MNALKFLTSYVLVLLCFTNCASAQNDSLFAEHLLKNKLYSELDALLLENSLSEQSHHLIQLKYYYNTKNDSLFTTKLNTRSYQSFLKDSCLTNSMLLHFIQPSKSATTFWEKVDLGNVRTTFMHSIYQFVKDPNKSVPNELPDYLKSYAASYKKYYNRKPLLAATFALIPGMGKIYAGKKYSGWSVLTVHALLGFQSYETYNKLGIKHPFTLFSVGFLGFNYLTNIVGSVIDLKRTKINKRNEFIQRTKAYYSGDFCFN